MARKKKIKSSDIVKFYMDYVLEHDHKPKSVYAFAKANDFDEADFYSFFSSFEALDNQVFKIMYDATTEALESSEDYQSFDARQRLLSFYFTFFENLTANRSFVLFLLGHGKINLKQLKVLAPLKKEFGKFIEELDIETIEIKQEQVDRIKERSIRETAWIQFLITLKFWMEDSSPGFEKTDIFIEKAVNTSFDLIDIKPIKSLIDLGKFLVKEKMHMN
ncbi:MAG: TetR/AcrR family transcriptional regulator [Flavobacteriaceae bacterium]|nr:TetR/AcrR family transcriptional regulator [Bacteroidia bacterium]NNF81340.1 TetR/AcrR family transcriptional regulator [Flavobacteriaceae bacterium]NNK70156.1 TetR/AcrR family transcriptional regulator [Flavobacteriaceae bacterium]